jgi:hypothetical protein
MVYALVKAGVVVNTILADATFAASLTGYDYVVRVDTLDPQPSIGWLYDGTTFTPQP